MSKRFGRNKKRFMRARALFFELAHADGREKTLRLRNEVMDLNRELAFLRSGVKAKTDYQGDLAISVVINRNALRASNNPGALIKVTADNLMSELAHVAQKEGLL